MVFDDVGVAAKKAFAKTLVAGWVGGTAIAGERFYNVGCATDRAVKEIYNCLKTSNIWSQKS